MKQSKLWQMVVVSMFLSAAVSWAQTTGSISGTVKDSTGAVLPSAKVMLLNEETGISRTVQSDASGRYSAPSLGLGNYRVTGSLEGFQTEIRTGIVLTVGREAVVDLTLTVGAVSQSVEVTGEAPMVESTTATLGSLVDDHTIRALPLNGRSYDQLALLQPGVILTSPGQISTGSALITGTGKRFSVGGQRSMSNSFLLDGTNINDEANGTPGGASGTNLGVDTIREFKIFTNSFKAEYGHSTGGVVTAITRSGTNTLHGTAFEYIRNSALDVRNFFDVGSSPPAFRRNQFGGVLGGPIKKDKTFFFGGYEGLRQGLATTQIATVPTLLARQGILPTGNVRVNPASVPFVNLYPAPNGRDFGDGSAEFLSSPSVTTNEDNFMVRLDHQLSGKTGLFGRYSFDNDNITAPLNTPPFLSVASGRRQYVTLQANSVFGPKALNNFRFAYNRTHNAGDTTTVTDPSVALVPGQPFGSLVIGSAKSTAARTLTPLGSGNGQGASIWAYNVFEWADDFSYVSGRHSFKAGVDFQRLRDNNIRTLGLRGVISFTTTADLLTGTPSSFQASSPIGVAPYWGIRQSLYGVYGQDDFAVSPRLTLNLGLRWETTTDPYDVNGKQAMLPSPSATAMVVSDRYFNISKKNFEPRIGLAWQMTSSGKTVLRAGGGIYHNQLLPWAFPQQINVPPFFGTFNTNTPVFPNPYLAFTGASTGLLALNVMNPAEKTPADVQYNLSIQHEILRNTVIQVAYAGNKGSHIIMLREADTPVPVIQANGQPLYPLGAPRRNTAWSGIRWNETGANSVYNSLTVTLRRQFSSGFQGQVFYTFSKSMDETSNVSNADSLRSPGAILDPNNRARDWGLSEFDSRHAVVANFSYQLPFRPASKVLAAAIGGWMLDGIGTFTAGIPLSARLSSSVSRDQSGVLAERPDLLPGARQNPNDGVSAGCAGFAAGTKLGGADNYFDPCAFSLPAAGTYGNLGRNTIIGPGVADIDVALEKTFKLHEEAVITFRGEAFNLMNHTNLGIPNPNPLTAAGIANASTGRITYTTTSSRQLQFALRLNF